VPLWKKEVYLFIFIVHINLYCIKLLVKILIKLETVNKKINNVLQCSKLYNL